MLLLSLRRRLALWMAVALMAGGCGADGGNTTEDTAADATFQPPADPSSNGSEPEVATIGDQLCDLASLAANDPVAAAGAFDHQPLHAIADELAATDRAAAGRLLEAKARAETLARDDPPNATDLSAALADLAAELPDFEGCHP